MRLCLAVGRLDFQRAMQELTSEELAWWQAYEAEFGLIGQERDDLLAGIVGAEVRNVLSKRNHPPKDCMPRWSAGRVNRQTPEHMQAMLKASLGSMLKRA